MKGFRSSSRSFREPSPESAARLDITEPHGDFQLFVFAVRLQMCRFSSLSLPSQLCFTCSRQLCTNLLATKQQMDTVLFYLPAAGDEAEGSETKTEKLWA